MALNKENNSNEKLSTSVITIQIMLCDGYIPLCYRISHINHICSQNSHQTIERYGLIMDPLTHSPTVANFGHPADIEHLRSTAVETT